MQAMEIPNADVFGQVSNPFESISSSPLPATTSRRVSLESRKNEYSTPAPVTVHVTTYNANGKPTGESIQKILQESDEAPDIYAFGLQEIVEFNVGTVMLYDTDSCLKWREHLMAQLAQRHGRERYVPLEMVHLVGTALILFIKAERRSQVSEIATGTVGCGILGTMGNKGGVGVRFEINGLEMAFTSCHLNSGQDKKNRRHQDARDIMQRLAFGDNQLPLRSHDVVLWCGDLNYRIDLPTDELIELMKAGPAVKPENWIQLAEDSDQLLTSRRAKEAFVGWEEAPLTFMPTYKYINGTNDYDPKRGPAWTDRIIWKGEGEYRERTQCKWYGRHELMDSDHKPVTGLFTIQHETIDLEKQAEVLASVMKELDAFENDLIPQISLDKNGVEFADVAYLDQIEKSFTITNDGTTLVFFEFVPQGAADLSVCLPWYSIHPLKGSLAPGASCEISVSLRVSEESVHLAHTRPSLEDIVVLHLENGRDYFITLQARMMPTIFGRSLEELCAQLPSTNATDTASLPIPAVVWRLVDALNDRIMEAAEKNWFIESGDLEEMVRIREAMTHQGDMASFGTGSLAHCLMTFLEALPESVIPEEVITQLNTQPVTSAIEEQKVLGLLPTPHYNTFIYIMSFIRHVLTQTGNTVTSETMLTQESLAFVFANALSGGPAAGKKGPTSPRTRKDTDITRGLVDFLLRFCS